MSHPCLEKNCWRCCDPVKIDKRRYFNDSDIPLNEKWEKIWIPKDETWVSERYPDSVKLDIFECVNYDKETRKCKDYENRPPICHNSWCIDHTSEKSIHDQYKETIQEKFFIINHNKIWKKI